MKPIPILKSWKVYHDHKSFFIQSEDYSFACQPLSANFDKCSWSHHTTITSSADRLWLINICSLFSFCQTEKVREIWARISLATENRRRRPDWDHCHENSTQSTDLLSIHSIVSIEKEDEPPLYYLFWSESISRKNEFISNLIMKIIASLC